MFRKIKIILAMICCLITPYCFGLLTPDYLFGIPTDSFVSYLFGMLIILGLIAIALLLALLYLCIEDLID